MTRPRVLLGGALVVVLLLLTSCAAGANEMAAERADADFWYGLWHGVITPVTFVISLFSDEVGIYEVRNVGAWYDFGYVLGLSIIFSGGGGAASRGRR